MCHDTWSATTIVIMQGDQVPLVLEKSKPLPHFWKFAGGRKDPGETPARTAARELEEETGLKVKREDLVLLKVEDRGSHDMYFFAVRPQKAATLSKDDLKERGDEGESIAVFALDELPHMMDFFPPHRKFLEEQGVL